MKKTLMILVGISLFAGLGAQGKTVKGKITVLDKLPVENVLIVVKSNHRKFYSDSLGLFTVQCSAKDKLTLSAEGFIKCKVRIKDATNYALINMRLQNQETAQELAVGYGHVKDRDKLNAISGRNNDEMDFSLYQDIYEVLTGNFSGIQILNGEVIVRSSSSFDSTNPALLIVDGRAMNSESFGSIPTSDIARISILKDASTAVYGVQGGNGVVVVETKRGK